MTTCKIVKLFAALLLLALMTFGTAVTVRAEAFDCAQNRHDYETIKSIPPTHTENGSITYKCRLCGLEYRETVFADGHEWSEWSTERQPTCTQSGLRRRTCTVGSAHSETEPIPPAGHKYEETIVEPTCKEAGETVYTCSVCGDTYSEPFGEPGKHQYTSAVTTEPACGSEGVKTFTCGGCGTSCTEPIPPLSHSFGGWVTDKPAKEGEEGSQYKECTLCGERVTAVIPALPVKPLFGPVEAVVTGANISALVVFSFLLFGEFALLLWEGRKKKELLAAKRFDENGEDGYEYL